ncbi:hypothetical protein GQ457_05G028260 [Hibiscus cannabinus]
MKDARVLFFMYAVWFFVYRLKVWFHSVRHSQWILRIHPQRTATFISKRRKMALQAKKVWYKVRHRWQYCRECRFQS